MSDTHSCGATMSVGHHSHMKAFKINKGAIKLGGLFEKYQNRFTAPQRAVIDVFFEVVLDILEIKLEPHQATYTPSTKTLIIHAQGPLKTEILLNSEIILIRLKEKLSEKNAPKCIL